MARIYQYYRTPNNDLDVWDFLNVSAVVGGKDGVNHPDDVMLVQALLRYLPPGLRGVWDQDCPLPNGTFNEITSNAIKQYQRNVNNRPGRDCGRIVEDGRVSPAESKYLFGGGAYMWTIINLNKDAVRVAKSRGFSKENSYMDDIYGLWPQVKQAVYRFDY